MSSNPITELDFDAFKAALKTYLQQQDIINDYDYDGAVINVLLDVLAYNGVTTGFYTNMAYGEMFLDSAQLRSSVLSHAKALNYLPQSYTSPRAVVTLSFDPSDDPTFITIPKYSKFTTTIDGSSRTFATRETYTLRPEGNVYTIADVSLYEGRIEKEYFQVTANTNRFVLSNDRIDTDSIDVVVYQSNSASAANTTYTVKDNLFGVTANDTVFYLQPAESNQYEITFGGGTFGRQPAIGEVVEVTYQITNGSNSNGANTFTSVGTIGGYTPTVTVTSRATGGASSETISSIKFNAPKAIQIQDRAVTASDYEILLKNKFSEVAEVSVYGGEEEDPPRYGKVIVAVDVTNADGVSENGKRKYQKYLSDRSPLSIEPVVVSPKFMYTEVVSTVYYNTEITDKGPGDIETIVRNAIAGYNTASLNGFKKNVRHSRLVRAIDDADSGIVSNDTKLRKIIDIVPVLNTDNSFALNFNNALDKDHELNQDEALADHDPAVVSTPFTYNGTTGFLQDNGKGVIQILASTSTDERIDGFEILNNDVGTVNYYTGTVALRNINVSAYTGTAIKVYARGVVQDILGPANRIISIRDADVTIDVIAAE